MPKAKPVAELTPEELELRRRRGRESAAKQRAKNPEKRKAYRRAWYRKNKDRAMELNARWEEGHPEAAKSMRILARVRARAKNRGLAVTITSKWIRARMQRCELTGIAFHQGPGRAATSLSVDRTDSSKGYTPENCKVICWALNAAFGDWGLEEFKKIWSKL